MLDWRYKFVSHLNKGDSFKNEIGWDHVGPQSEGVQRRENI